MVFIVVQGRKTITIGFYKALFMVEGTMSRVDIQYFFPGISIPGKYARFTTRVDHPGSFKMNHPGSLKMDHPGSFKMNHPGSFMMDYPAGSFKMNHPGSFKMDHPGKFEMKDEIE
ncbi:hypothetical protein LOTGIDRAFT_171890 [Lottia gigantea]|uniref:Uncharacterized protein n=1 Tax=Lottia gigantea TaxID=225164 RepID=V4B501_LOTGI|nr:hypothetical protein LOTGIDRAFT_171890 [Lottia gigantea]ESP02571.1 hypothetical protein LOTGIDRAFT_171890 [Lottia gigantea]